MSWNGSEPAGLDLYYDPTVDEHVLHGPMGVVVPGWYFAPQLPEVARAGWNIASALWGVQDEAPIPGLDDPSRTVMLLQIAGEFADPATKARIWAAAEPHIEPQWDRDRGEFTLGFGLDEAHPRGQLNARAMAGWVCTEGAWSRLFNAPNLAKFDEPLVEGVDFPRFALCEARWDGRSLHLAAAAQNRAMSSQSTRFEVSNLPAGGGWVLDRGRGEAVTLQVDNGMATVELVGDGSPARILRR
ncbi:MAG TPA: hypothetical protein VIS76_12910 [Pseudomonadales bacterium]